MTRAIWPLAPIFFKCFRLPVPLRPGWCSAGTPDALSCCTCCYDAPGSLDCPPPRLALCLVAILIWGLALHRLSLTGFAPRLCAVLGAGLVLSLLIQPLLAGLAGALGTTIAADEVRVISAVVMLAWVIRLGGLLHPQAYTSDLGLHMHNLENLIRGEVIFTEDLPARAGGGPAPYPPVGYVMLAPWHLLANSEQTTRIGNTLADSLVIVALLAAAAYGWCSFHCSIVRRWVVPVRDTAAECAVDRRDGERLGSGTGRSVSPDAGALATGTGRIESRIWCSALGMTIGLLGHFGVFLSLVIFLGLYARSCSSHAGHGCALHRSSPSHWSRHSCCIIRHSWRSWPSVAEPACRLAGVGCVANWQAPLR